MNYEGNFPVINVFFLDIYYLHGAKLIFFASWLRFFFFK